MDHSTECTGNTPTCTGWQWCGWCGGQPGGCEFCDGAGKRGCPAVVGDTDGNQWAHGTARPGEVCTATGDDMTPGRPVFRRADAPDTVACVECVSPAHRAAPGL